MTVECNIGIQMWEDPTKTFMIFSNWKKPLVSMVYNINNIIKYFRVVRVWAYDYVWYIEPPVSTFDLNLRLVSIQMIVVPRRPLYMGPKRASGIVFSYKLRYIAGFWLVEMAISTYQKPTIYCILYDDTGPEARVHFCHIFPAPWHYYWDNNAGFVSTRDQE